MSSRLTALRSLNNIISTGIAVIVILSSLFTPKVHAQHINLGAEVSGALVSLDFTQSDPFVDVTGRFSGSAAVIGTLPFGHLSLQSGLRYSRIGAVRNFTYELPERGPDGSITGTRHEAGNTTISLHYIGADLRARYDVWPGKMFIVAGPELGYLLSARSVTVRHGHAGDPHRESHTENMRRINLAAKAGIGSPFRLYGRELYVQMLYARGLFSVSEHKADSALTNELAVSLGVRF